MQLHWIMVMGMQSWHIINWIICSQIFLLKMHHQQMHLIWWKNIFNSHQLNHTLPISGVSVQLLMNIVNVSRSQSRIKLCNRKQWSVTSYMIIIEKVHISVSNMFVFTKYSLKIWQKQLSFIRCLITNSRWMFFQEE